MVVVMLGPEKLLEKVRVGVEGMELATEDSVEDTTVLLQVNGGSCRGWWRENRSYSKGKRESRLGCSSNRYSNPGKTGAEEAAGTAAAALAA